jgi:hypothetical protein
MQSTQQENVIITRQRVAQVGSVVGGVALLMGLLGLIWTGLSTFTIAALIIAAIGIATWAGFAPGDFRDFVTGRQARYGTVAFFSALFLAGIVAMSFLMVRNSGVSFDLTQSESYTLSPETLQVLRGVIRPMQVTGFYTARALPAREIDNQFFQRYVTATNGMIRVLYIDPDEAPAVAQAYNVQEDGDVFLVFLNPDGTPDLTTRQPVPRSGNQERDMTGAIMRMLFAGSTTIYFVTSHGTRDAQDLTTPEGLGTINELLKTIGYITAPVDLSALAQSGGDIPADARTVIIARPLLDFNEQEVGLIDRYLDRGGSILLMPDVQFTPDFFLKQSGIFNNYLAANYGIRALDAAIVDPAASSGTALDIISAVVVANTVTPNLDPAVNPALFRLSRAIEVTPPTIANVVNGQFVSTSPEGYAETNLTELGTTNTFAYNDGQDIRGPIVIAAWAEDQNTRGRIVLIGDSDFVTNGQLNPNPTGEIVTRFGNGILLTDTITWLTNTSQSVEFAPSSVGIGLPLLTLDNETRNIVAFVAIVLLPGVVLAAGVFIWLRRSRA